MEGLPGKQAQTLGKFFSLRGRTSTNVIETLYTPVKGEIDPLSSRLLHDTSRETSSIIGDVASTKKSNEVETASTKSFTTITRDSTADNMSKDSHAETFMKNNPIVSNLEMSAQPVHYRVHGTDAKQYAMRALGNVDTLLNRYGYEDTERKRYQYQY